VTGVRAEKLPARGIDGGRRRWPRRIGENGEEGNGVDNKRTGEVHGCLVKLLEQLASGEREREHELRAAVAAMAAEGLGMARWGSEEGFK
jgi:hypothetical protein